MKKLIIKINKAFKKVKDIEEDKGMSRWLWGPDSAKKPTSVEES